ncbi:hypothetical protein ACRRTK_011864 [Alexandromys fortis]
MLGKLEGCGCSESPPRRHLTHPASELLLTLYLNASSSLQEGGDSRVQVYPGLPAVK